VIALLVALLCRPLEYRPASPDSDRSAPAVPRPAECPRRQASQKKTPESSNLLILKLLPCRSDIETRIVAQRSDAVKMRIIIQIGKVDQSAHLHNSRLSLSGLTECHKCVDSKALKSEPISDLMLSHPLCIN